MHSPNVHIQRRFALLLLLGGMCSVFIACQFAATPAEASYYERNPSWSPDGKSIAFECLVGPKDSDHARFDICTIGADGTGWKKLTVGQYDNKEPTWSPDGKLLAFISDRSGKPDVYIMRPSGIDLKRITTHGKIEFLSPLSWSPDSKFLVYEAWSEGLQIHKVDVQTYQDAQLTDSSQGNYNQTPRWSPDGRTIAFVSNRDANLEVYLMRPDGTGQENLTRDSADESEPAWSPNGTTLAFQRNQNGKSEIYIADLDRLDIKRSHLHRIADGISPIWSPNGVNIAFGSIRSAPAASGIFIIPAGHDANEVNVFNGATFFRLAWSPDNQRLAFTASEPTKSPLEDPFQIWVVNVDGSRLQRFTPTK
jgi:Tol biopolymer transport system component